MEEMVIQINAGIMINVDVHVRKAKYVKKITFGVLLHVIVKMENIWQVLWIILELYVSHSMTKQILMKKSYL